MSDIIPSKSIDIEEELKNLQLYKNHPNGILNVSLDRLKDMLDGRVEIVDPNNPFTYLLETSCINTAFAVQEATLLSRKQYLRLANNEDDIYLHMSDKDYLGRFSTPASKEVRFNILLNGFETNAYKDPLTGDFIHTIPKNFKVTVDEYVFTLTAPIVIRITATGIIDVRYKGEESDSIFELETNYINFDTYALNQDESYITFEAKLNEVDLEAVEIPVEKSKLFKGTINFENNRLFYYFKAYHLTGDGWEEMITTHTDQVYDIMTPTCIVKVNQTDSSLEYYIPPVYVNTGRLGSKVKFVTYTTLGPVSVNFADYRVDDFKTEYNDVFPEIELDETTRTLNTIPKVVMIEGMLTDGKPAKSFEALKSSVIDNNLGRNHRPVTNVQIDNFVNDTNFKLIRNVDTLTNRIFLLETKLPEPTNRYSVSNINLGVMEYLTSVGDLRSDNNSVIAVDEFVTIIPEGTLFIDGEDGLKILSNLEYAEVKGLSGNNLAKRLNTNKYVSLYYHYILDTSNNATSLKAYDLSDPQIHRTNFRGFNVTARIGINTINTNMVKSSTGFQLDVLANIRKYDEQYDETNIKPYIVYRDVSGSVFYLEGNLFADIEGNPVYRFSIESEYYIDSDNKIYINNFKDINGASVVVSFDLKTELEIIYLTNRIPTLYEPSSMDDYIRGSFIGPGNGVVTLESAMFIFGEYLEYLYSRVHTSTGIEDYVLYEEDVLLTYDRNVYGPDNSIIHHQNETMLDEFGEPIYKHVKGEMVLDSSGLPVVEKTRDPLKYLNLLFIDYKSVVADDVNLVEYRNRLKSYMTSIITKEVGKIQEVLLENTVAYLTVPSSLGNTMVRDASATKYISSSQSFRISLYVDSRTYEDTETKTSIESVLKKELQDYISSSKSLSKSILVNRMLGKVGDFVRSISVDQFTETNSEYMEIVESESGLSFKNSLVVSPEGYRIEEDVKFVFILVK